MKKSFITSGLVGVELDNEAGIFHVPSALLRISSNFTVAALKIKLVTDTTRLFHLFIL